MSMSFVAWLMTGWRRSVWSRLAMTAAVALAHADVAAHKFFGDASPKF